MSAHKRFSRYAAALLALAILSFSSQAKAADVADVIGGNCSDDSLGTTKGLGRTKMADDGENIIACLKDSSGKLVWKSMTSSGGGNYGGMFTYSVDISVLGGGLLGGRVSGYGAGSKRSGDLYNGLVFDDTYRSVGHCILVNQYTGKCSCPSGYVARAMFSTAAYTDGSEYAHDSGDTLFVCETP